MILLHTLVRSTVGLRNAYGRPSDPALSTALRVSGILDCHQGLMGRNALLHPTSGAHRLAIKETSPTMRIWYSLLLTMARHPFERVSVSQIRGHIRCCAPHLPIIYYLPCASVYSS